MVARSRLRLRLAVPAHIFPPILRLRICCRAHSRMVARGRIRPRLSFPTDIFPHILRLRLFFRTHTVIVPRGSLPAVAIARFTVVMPRIPILFS